MAKFILSLCVIITLLGVAAPAYAYLDPGTGSSLLQGLFAGVAGVLAVLKLYWQRIKTFFSAKKKPKHDDANKKE
jgi:hypothetical protein